MEELLALLQTVVDRIMWPSEEKHQAALGQLRKFAASVGIGGVVTPPSGQTAPPPAETPAVPVPGAVATPDTDALVAAGWTPPASSEVGPAPEAGNAFAAPPSDAPGTPPQTQ